MFGVVYFIGGLVFLLFGSGVPRKWATFQKDNKQQVEEKLNDDEVLPMNEQKSVKT